MHPHPDRLIGQAALDDLARGHDGAQGHPPADDHNAISGLLYALARDRTLTLVAFVAMLSHLVLDTVATQWGVMWLWPLSTHEFVIWTLGDLAVLAILKVYLFLFPVMWTWHTWRTTGESPLRVVEWIDARIPRPVLYGATASFGLLMVFVYVTEYMWILTS